MCYKKKASAPRGRGTLSRLVYNILLLPREYEIAYSGRMVKVSCLTLLFRSYEYIFSIFDL